MPQAFSCPNCTAPLDVDTSGDATIRCPFCNTSVIVPENMRASVKPDAEEKATRIRESGEFASLKRLGELVRAGKVDEAVALYQKLLGVSEAEARAGVERLAAGQPVSITHIQPQDVEARLSKGGGGVAAGCIVFGVVLAIIGGAVGVIAAVSPALLMGIFTTVVEPTMEAYGDMTEEEAFEEFFGDSEGDSQGNAPESTGYANQVNAFGSEGIGQGQFDDARYVTVDPSGHIYVGDYSDGRIQVFNRDGSFLHMWNIENDTPLRGLDVTTDGVIYATFNSRLYRFNAETGELLNEVAYPGGPGFDDVDVSPEGLVYTTYGEAGNEQVIVVDRNGTPSVLIEHAITSVIEDAPPFAPRIAVDGLGNIYLLSSFANAVVKYSRDGQYLDRFGGEGETPGKFRAPYEIAVDGQGRIYVTDIFGIHVFDADGVVIDYFAVPGAIYGLGFDNSNLLYIAQGDEVLVYQINE